MQITFETFPFPFGIRHIRGYLFQHLFNTMQRLIERIIFIPDQTCRNKFEMIYFFFSNLVSKVIARVYIILLQESCYKMSKFRNKLFTSVQSISHNVFWAGWLAHGSAVNTLTLYFMVKLYFRCISVFL